MYHCNEETWVCIREKVRERREKVESWRDNILGAISK